MTTQQKLIQKQDEYIKYLKRFVQVSVNCESMVNFESELSQLKAEAEKEQNGLNKLNDSEWADPLWKKDQDVKEVVKEEQSLSAEEALMKHKVIAPFNVVFGQEATEWMLDIGITAKRILQAMHEFRDQGRDWEKIAKNFHNWQCDELSDHIFEEDRVKIINWFKSNL